MVKKMDDDSSSSEDEISKEALKEAADHDFLKDAYFSGTSKTPSAEKSGETSVSKETNAKTASLKSLRKQKDEKDQFDNFGVTPSFKNFVAKKLDEMIERNIKVKKTSEDTDPQTESKQQDNSVGIKLLHSSKTLLTAEDDVEEPIKYKKRRKQDEKLLETENTSMCKEVVVDSHWVLSKEGTKGWTPKRNDLEFKYKKLKNGVLVEKE